MLGRHRATVGRELKRFEASDAWRWCGLYVPDHAHRFAGQTRSRRRGCRWVRHRPLLDYVKGKLLLKWSPEQIAGRLPLDHPGDERMRVSHTSIYRWIKADRVAGGDWWTHLRQSRKRRRRRYGSGPRPSRIPDRVGIARRPLRADERREVGHAPSGGGSLHQGRLPCAAVVSITRCRSPLWRERFDSTCRTR
jgi:transposase, IS30 family